MFEYITHKEYDKKLTTPFDTMPYFSKHKMKQRYPKGGFITIGAFGPGTNITAGEMLFHNSVITYCTLHYHKLLYAIDGYIDCGNDQYIAIIQPAIKRNTAILLPIAICLLGLFLWFNGNQDAYDPNAKAYTPNNEAAVTSDGNHIALPGYDDIKLEAGSDIAYLALWNPEGNPCLFQFTLEKDGDVLYESGLIEPGKAVTEVKLKEKIAKGVHDATLRINTYDLQDPTIKLNGGEVMLKLIGLEIAAP